jgi:N-acetylmuramoyl-L-alanine amidase
MTASRLRIFAVCLALAAAAGAAQKAPSDAPRMQVQFDADPVTYTVGAAWRDSVLYVSLQELADVLGFNRFTNPLNRKTVLRIGTHAVKTSACNPFVMIDDAVVQMILSEAEIDDRPYVPAASFLEGLGNVFPFRYELSSQPPLLRLRRIRYTLSDFTVTAKENGLRITIATTRRFQPSDVAVSFNDGWLHATVLGGSLDTLAMASNGVPGLFSRAVSYQFENSAQMSFHIGREITDKAVTVQDDAIVISLWLSEKAAPPVQAESDEAKSRWLIDTIVIDPGHGGRDPGAIGPTGLREKTVTLDVAKRLAQLIERRLPRVKVLLTRDSDTLPPLKERTKFANAHGGKLFISIHANANRNRNVRGFSSYLLGVGKNRQAVEVAQLENSVVEYEDSPEVYEEYQDFDYILNSIALNSFNKESQHLATLINQSLGRETKLVNQGVHQQGFWVLVGASMPSVLIETAFISNPYEERLLKTNAFQQKVAESLCTSIVQFKDKYEKEIR